MKQWNLEPKALSPTVCGRIPVRTNDDCRYFTDKYQFMPKEGYTKMFEKMLKHKNIEILLSIDFKSILNDIRFDKIIYTGPIDYFFDYEYGKLPYRSLRFEYKTFNTEYYQPTAQVNYVDNQSEFSRVVEHKYLSSKKSQKTVISFEYSQFEGEPYYPIPTSANKRLYDKYSNASKKLRSVKFLGRLAEYQYYNMDQVVANTLKMFEGINF